ncbi:MAG: ATP-binding protein [Phycisphaerae bacterium]
MSKERSPFSPGEPVQTEFFVGRDDQVKLVNRALMQAANRKPQYVFITGERGIGKSSLAALAKELAEKEYGMVGAHASLGGADSLGEACRRLYQALVTQLPDKGLYEKAKEVFSKFIDKIDLFGLGVEFRRDDASRKAMAESFIPMLFRANQAFQEAGKKGMLLIADDLNGVVRDPQFAHFLKSTVDQIAVGPQRDFPWVLMLVGVEERMEDMRAQQPSVVRIFQYIDLPPLEKRLARDFFAKTFQSVNHTCDDEAMELMASAAGGFPVVWHEIGDAVFWKDDDMRISVADAQAGIQVAAEAVGRKYLRPFYEELKNPAYPRILDYIATLQDARVSRSDALGNLPQDDEKYFDYFVQKMKKMRVLRQLAAGEYQFTSPLYWMYIVLQASASRDEE